MPLFDNQRTDVWNRKASHVKFMSLQRSLKTGVRTYRFDVKDHFHLGIQHIFRGV